MLCNFSPRLCTDWTSPPSARMSNNNRTRSRNQTLALVGGAVAAASLALAAYRWYGSSGASADGPGQSSGAGARRPGASSTAPRTGARPTMALSLPPEFSHAPDSIRSLAQLLRTLSEHYVIHLIAPESPSGPSHSNFPPGGRPAPPSLDDEGDEPDEKLARSLSGIPNFDTRRILEYSQPAGRHALGRALACDAHVHVLQPPHSSSQESEKLQPQDQAMVDAQIAQLEQLQKSVGLLVILSVPRSASAPSQSEQLCAKHIVSAFDGRAGIRVVAEQEPNLWDRPLAKLIELRSSWK